MVLPEFPMIRPPRRVTPTFFWSFLRAYPKRDLILCGEAKKTNESDSPPKVQNPF
jgi:hypothetical protein